MGILPCKPPVTESVPLTRDRDRCSTKAHPLACRSLARRDNMGRGKGEKLTSPLPHPGLPKPAWQSPSNRALLVPKERWHQHQTALNQGAGTLSINSRQRQRSKFGAHITSRFTQSQLTLLSKPRKLSRQFWLCSDQHETWWDNELSIPPLLSLPSAGMTREQCRERETQGRRLPESHANPTLPSGSNLNVTSSRKPLWDPCR